MKRKRRLLSVLLVAAVLLAFVPMGAQATEEEHLVESIEQDAEEEVLLDKTEDVETEQNISEDGNEYNISRLEANVENVDEKNDAESDNLEITNISEDKTGGEEREDAGAEDLSEMKEGQEKSVVLLRADGDGDPKAVDVSITSFDIQNLSHETVTSVFYSDTFYLAMDWDASGHGVALHEGDYFDITLPDNMMFPEGTTARDFNLTDENGDVVATAHVTTGEGDVGGTVHVIFTSTVEDKYNVKGTLYLASRFDRTQVTTGETNTFSITVNGNLGGPTIGTDVVVVGPKELENEYLAKWGQSVYGEPNMAEWWVRINHVKATLTNVVITDTMGSSGETYIRDSFQLRLVEYDSYGNTVSSQPVDISDKLVISEDGKSFTLYLGDIDGDQYRLIYRTTYTPGTTLRNSLTLSTEEMERTYTATHISANSGGTGGGDLASRIKLIKVDENDETKLLAGAVFEVTAPDGSSFELTTGADGTVTSDLLTQGSYKVKEIVSPVGYELNSEEFTLNVSTSGGAIQTVTNHVVTTTISGSKHWNDGNNQDGIRPRSITIHLLANGNEVDSKIITEEDDWSWAFDDLPMYEDGEEITYSIREDDVSGYTPIYLGNDVTNLHAPSKTSVTVGKIWDDSNNQDGIRPDNVTVKLLADGVDTGKTEQLDDGNDWTATFSDLDEYKDGRKIEYKIEEVAVEGYVSEISGDDEDGYIITNAHQPELISINGTKTWEDADDQDGVRPENITIRLLANGTEVDSKTVSESDGWSWQFADWPKFAGGTEIVYSVTEDAIPDYSTTYNGYDIVNTHAPNKTSVTVTKKWEDGNDQDGIRPDSITVKLLADGKDTGLTLELSADNQWNSSFTNLDVYKNGSKVKYTVEENVEGYVTTISGDPETGFIITNTLNSANTTTPNIIKPKQSINNKSLEKTTAVNKPQHPKTGDKEHMELYFGIIALAILSLVISIVVRKEKEKQENY